MQLDRFVTVRDAMDPALSAGATLARTPVPGSGMTAQPWEDPRGTCLLVPSPGLTPVPAEPRLHYSEGAGGAPRRTAIRTSPASSCGTSRCR